uniref:DhaK domain-containing protein n=1 Tax=Ascaris lumbricoides TaxID=6252 RepID=A0A0M3IX01_ASCLU
MIVGWRGGERELASCKRVVFRSDLRECNKRNVMLVAGGGSGHEPFAAGFVGKGLLSAAVCGNIFASPPTSHITAALEDLKSKHGVVVFVINYTGDRLNFGLAIERFNTHRTAMMLHWKAVKKERELDDEGLPARCSL